MLGNEIDAFIPFVAKKLVSYHASKLPPTLSDRMFEEWMADLQNIPGNFGQLFFSIDLFRASKRITHEFNFDTQYRLFENISLRAFDIFFSLIGLAFVAPIFLIVPIFIKFDSSGGTFYRNEMIGKNGAHFILMRFRTTQTCPDKKLSITRLGRILKSLRLDELPLLINVLKGEMSFVGPHPECPCLAKTNCEDIPNYNLKYSVRPGIFRMEWNQETSQLEAEKLYIENRSTIYYFKSIIHNFKK